MAAIDKLYLTEYNDLEDLRLWALVYYPKLFFYFYSSARTINETDFEKDKKKYAKKVKQMYASRWREISPDGTINGAVAYLLDKCKDLTEDGARDLAEDAYNNSRVSVEELADTIGVTVMNTPIRVDKKLKWTCPLPCIRKYLQEQCGVKEHWYYKLFWKGKKRFL